jgi:hypothetical protein
MPQLKSKKGDYIIVATSNCPAIFPLKPDATKRGRRGEQHAEIN